jgi:hypothetical protein
MEDCGGSWFIHQLRQENSDGFEDWRAPRFISCPPRAIIERFAAMARKVLLLPCRIAVVVGYSLLEFLRKRF